MRNKGADLAVRLVDQRCDQVHNPLLARRGRVQLSAYLCEALTYVVSKIAEVTSEVDEVRAQRV